MRLGRLTCHGWRYRTYVCCPNVSWNAARRIWPPQHTVWTTGRQSIHRPSIGKTCLVFLNKKIHKNQQLIISVIWYSQWQYHYVYHVDRILWRIINGPRNIDNYYLTISKHRRSNHIVKSIVFDRLYITRLESTSRTKIGTSMFRDGTLSYFPFINTVWRIL